MTMMKTTIVISLLCVITYFTSTTAQIQLRTAGPTSSFLADLPTTETKICPSLYPSGVTIQCIGDNLTTSVKFLVNGEFQRLERSAPFFIAGDRGGSPSAWTDFPAKADIICIKRPSQQRFSTTVIFDCSSDTSPSSEFPITSPPVTSKTIPDGTTMATTSDTPSTTDVTTNTDQTKRPGSMFFKPAGRPSDITIRITEGMVICPQTDLGTKKISVTCTPSKSSNQAVFRLNGKLVRTDRRLPFHLTKELRSDVSIPRRWRKAPSDRFRITCELDDGNVEDVRNVLISCDDVQVGVGGDNGTANGGVDGDGGTGGQAAGDSVDQDGNVGDSASPDGGNADGVTNGNAGDDGMGVSADGNVTGDSTDSGTDSINGDSNSGAGCIFIDAKEAEPTNGWVAVEDGLIFRPDWIGSNITGAGRAPLVYMLVPTTTSQYAVIVDMTTSGGSEHNDVWLQLKGGFQIMRKGVASMVTGWTKGYHNKRGRAAFVSTVDNNAHSISSGAVLQQGVHYVFKVGGRSSLVTFHRLLFFPCEGDGCQRGGWREKQNACIPGSIEL